MSEQDSKQQILKSTGILGLAQVFIILISMIRVKVLAVLLGPIGVGIAGIYQVTFDLIKSVTGLGISSSAVRDIAKEETTKDERRIATIVTTLKRWVIFTGFLGMLVAIVFSRQLSRYAFGNTSYATGIAILSVAVFMSSISAGQLAILQGLRRIKDMARANVTGAFIGLLASIAVYYFFGLEGIVPALLATAAIALVISWYYSSRVSLQKVIVSNTQAFQKGKSMVRLGFFMVISGLASTGTMYLTRSFIVQREGLEAVGYFVAAWSISSMYIAAIFGAMGADFYPRLSAVQHDNKAVVKLVNEQTEVAVLLSAPIIMGMVSFTGLVVQVLYARDFGSTATILSWQLLGDFFKILTWPMGYIFLAKGKGVLFITTEIVWNLLYFSGIWIGWQYFSIEVTGIVFLLAYVIIIIITYFIVGKLAGFVWSKQVIKSIAVFIPLLTLSFLMSRYLAGWAQYAGCTVCILLSMLYSFFELKKTVSFRILFQRKNTKGG